MIIRRLPLLLAAIVSLANASPDTIDVSFTAKNDGTVQNYVKVLPDGFDTAAHHDLLIALHGAGFDRWQFVTDQRGECEAARRTAINHNMIYVSPDYRCCLSFMGIKADQDVMQIIGELKAQYHIARVFICGASMGGMGCLTFTVLHPELIAGVASMNGTGNFFEWPGGDFGPIVESFGGTMTQVPDEYRRRSAEFWPQNFTMPVGFTCGGKDSIVPPQSVLRLADTLQKRHSQVMMIYHATGVHSTLYRDGMSILSFAVDSAKAWQPPTSVNRDARMSPSSMPRFISMADAGRIPAGAFVYDVQGRRLANGGVTEQLCIMRTHGRAAVIQPWFSSRVKQRSIK
jgi:pimeloyl-ACP methyl ester carboxylesterase